MNIGERIQGVVKDGSQSVVLTEVYALNFVFLIWRQIYTNSFDLFQDILVENLFTVAVDVVPKPV